MAVSSKDIETLWKRYSSEASKRGVFNGYFQRIAEGMRDYDLITEDVFIST